MTDAEREAQIRSRINAWIKEGVPEINSDEMFVWRLLDEAREADMQWQEIAGMIQEELTKAGQRGSATPPMNFNDAIRKIVRERDEARGEIARLKAPPGAGAMERATKAWYERITKEATVHGKLIEFARAIEQAESEASAAAIEEAAQFHASQPGNPSMRKKEADDIRALAAKRTDL